MRIALDGHSLGSGASGNSRYVLGLLEGLAQVTAQTDDEILLYMPAEHDSPRLELPTNERQRLIPLRSRSAISRLAWELPRRLRHDRADVAHFQYIGPLSSPCPLVVAVHDVSFCLAPGILGWRTTWRMRLTTKRALRAARVVLTPSAWSAQMVARFFPEAKERIRVVPLGVSANFSPTTDAEVADIEVADAEVADAEVADAGADPEIRAGLGLPDDYFLYVGRRQLRKNISGLVESYARALEQEPELPSLVLVGPSGENDRAWRARLAENRLQDRVVVLDDVGDAALPAIYRGARIFLFPCRYEGFGLPVLEAMACGVPVIVADEGGLPELVGHAGTRADPTDPEAWAHAIVSLSRDAARRQQLSARGLKIASRYSWRQTAEATFAEYAGACRT